MKLRRSLALAAATAAIAPAVLLAAPAAYATDGSPSPTVSESTPAEETSTPPADDTTPTAPESTPTESASPPAEEEPSPSASDSASPSAPVSASPSASMSASPSASASTTASPGPVECADGETDEDGEDIGFDDELHTGLSGLPSKIVAGSGFHGFKLDVENTGSHSYQRVDLGVFAGQIDEEDFFLDTSYLTLQFKDPSTGNWTDISLDVEDEGAG